MADLDHSIQMENGNTSLCKNSPFQPIHTFHQASCVELCIYEYLLNKRGILNTPRATLSMLSQTQGVVLTRPSAP